MCLGKSVKEKFEAFTGSPSIAIITGLSIDTWIVMIKIVKDY